MQAHLIAKKNGLEAWITFDPSAEVFEIWAEPECECWIGCADTRREAERIARDWFAERACN